MLNWTLKQLFHIISLTTVLFTSVPQLSARAQESRPTGQRENYLTVQRDFRKCVSPLCGGYWVTPLNQTKPSVYVSRIILDEDQEFLSETIDSQITRGLIILKGQFGPREPQFQTLSLRVSEVYALAGKEIPALDLTFAKVSQRQPPINCLVAPCPNLLAGVLNSRKVQAFDQLTGGEQLGYDLENLTSLALSPDTIVVGSFKPGTTLFPGGYETLFDVKALYTKLQSSSDLPSSPY